MKQILLITLALIFITSCAKGVKESTVSIQVDNPNAHVVVEVQGHRYKVKLDSTAYGEQVITLEKGSYAKIMYGRTWTNCYISPGNTLHATYKKVKDYASFTLDCEDGGMNVYLMQIRGFKYGWNEGLSKEDQFLSSFDAKVDSAVANVEHNTNLSKYFKTVEAQRLKYIAAGVLLNYPQRHKGYRQENRGYQPTEAYYDKLNTLLVEKPELFAFSVYKNYISRASLAIVRNEHKNMDMISLTEECIKMVAERFKDPKIKEYLVKEYALSAVSSKGAQGAEEIVKLFKLYVTDKSALKKMDGIINKWNTIAIGQASPTFNYEDINGNMVSLASLKGKYIYIDCWATWCGPCRGEIPHLQKLEHDYANKNIHFVSISSDRNKQAWTKMVKKDKLGGIQLHRGDDKSFSTAFMITGIPRFILLDKEGRIVKSKAPRPSQKETRDLFDSLEGI